MPLDASFIIPSENAAGEMAIDIKAGTSVIFVGANGTGKTRLGVLIDRQLSPQGIEVHRVSAHRSLSLNPDVVPPSLEIALKRLRFGYDQGDFNYKWGHRYGNKPETQLLSDFDHLLSALYAENNDVSIKYRQDRISNPGENPEPPPAKLDILEDIWEEILPHRDLHVLGGNIKTRTRDEDFQEYSAAEMSDGERGIFYLIAQALLAQPDTVLVFDEPESHINRSVLSKLWDRIEAARPDCCFLFITHDVDFAASRRGSAKYALRGYSKHPREQWDIEAVPTDAGLPDDIVATIVGSRSPVLFIEGTGGSLDSALYRRAYSKMTVIPTGSCDAVIHTVASFASSGQLHRVGCAGLVDADGRGDVEAQALEALGVYRLPVSEVENLLLLPQVFVALAKALNFELADAEERLSVLKQHVYGQATAQIDDISLRYTKRRIDAEMKRIGLASRNLADLQNEFQGAAQSIDPTLIFEEFKTALEASIAASDYERVLLCYDNKGLLSEAARQLGFQQNKLEEFIGRAMRSDGQTDLHDAIVGVLPDIVPRP